MMVLSWKRLLLESGAGWQVKSLEMIIVRKHQRSRSTTASKGNDRGACVAGWQASTLNGGQMKLESKRDIAKF